MTTPIYAIGDIHGHLDKLEEVMEAILADGGPEAEVVFLGDLVDRGPDSRGVIDFVLDGLKQGRKWTILTGNHDRMFRYFLEPSPASTCACAPTSTGCMNVLAGAKLWPPTVSPLMQKPAFPKYTLPRGRLCPQSMFRFWPSSPMPNSTATCCLYTQASDPK
jgi:hypothetical protein